MGTKDLLDIYKHVNGVQSVDDRASYIHEKAHREGQPEKRLINGERAHHMVDKYLELHSTLDDDKLAGPYHHPIQVACLVK